MITLNQGQQAVLSSAMKFLLSPDERFMVIKGRAGTGKSTLLEALIPAIDKHLKMISLLLSTDTTSPVHISATTNKAAKVTADITNGEAGTIHSLLGLRVRQDYQSGETKLTRSNADVIKNSIILIDEAFYIDPLLQKYINDCTINCKIIFIGDPYQCAPIRQTHSPIEDLVCRTEELTQVMRNSGILTDIGEHWRNTVITGQFTPCPYVAPGIIDYVSGQDFQDLIEQEYLNTNVSDDKNKIICWTNNLANQYSDHVRRLRGLPAEFSVGESLQVVNSLPKQGIRTDTIIKIKSFEPSTTAFGLSGRYAATDLGKQLFIPNSGAEYTAAVKAAAKAKDWTKYFALQEQIPDLRAIHACTIHKAQGSTYDNVFVDLSDIGKCNIASDVARMMHVAVTRPRKRLIFRGKLPDKYGG